MTGFSLFLILIFTFVATVLIVYGAFSLLGDVIMVLFKYREREEQKALQDLFIKNMTPKEIFGFSIIGGIITSIVVALISGSVTFGIGLGIGVLFLPKPIFQYLKAQRQDRFNEQLPAALDQMTSSTKAGLSLAQAIEEVARTAQPPISQEFSIIVHEYDLGSDLATAIQAARPRLRSRNFNLAATALLVNREKGGNLPETLETLSNSLKEIWRLEQKMITASAEGRKAIKLIAAMPFFIYVMVATAQPELAEVLVSSFAGLAILSLAVFLYLAAIWWLNRTLQVDI